MTETCRYCSEPAVVPVLDKNIERSPKAGNKFRRFCLACTRVLPMTSEEYFREHDRPHVLQVGDSLDPDEPGSVVPLNEYDYGPEWDDLADQIQNGQTAATDGGESDRSSDDVDDAGDDADDEEANRFECPRRDCDEVHDGYPDECDCGAVYNW